MDDDRVVDSIGAMVTALAEPRTPPPDALGQIVAATTAARRRRRLMQAAAAVAAVAVIAAVAGLAVPHLRHDQSPTHPLGDGAITADGHARVFTLSVTLAYPTARRILHGSFVADGQVSDAEFYTENVDDVLVPSLDVDADETIYLDGIVRLDCEGDASPPRALVTYRLLDGTVGTQQIDADPAAWTRYQDERAWWCSVPAHADLYSISRSADGTDVVFTLDVTNTTGHPVEVVSGPMEFAGARWPRAAVTVQPGASTRLSVSPTNFHRGPKPWNQGLLTADGVVIRFRR